MLIRYFLPLFLTLGVVAEEAALTGERLFTINCSACHQPTEGLVGPSMVEIRTLYAKNLPGFIEWAKNPKQKRKGAVEMPSMAHIPDDQLEKIHAHIVNASEGLVEKEKVLGDPFADSQTVSQRPNLIRIFMPDAGPAAIAVAVDDTYSYCWDAGACRLRYVWRDGFIDAWDLWSGKGYGAAEIQGEMLLSESQSPLAGLLHGSQMKYLGYSLKDKIPTFRYDIGSRSVTERIEVKDGKLTRSFAFSPALDGDLEVPLSGGNEASWTSSDGVIKDGRLIITEDSASGFILTLIEP